MPFNHKDCIRQFAEDIASTIRRHRSENELTYAEAIGTLEMMKAGLMKEALSGMDHDDEGEVI